MAIPWLPKLDKNNNKVTIEGKGGVWNNTVSLGNIESSLAGPPARTVTDDITSIPDLWARPLMYKVVLKDNHHPLHDRFVKEWRAILAMLALRVERDLYEIKAKYVVIPAMDKVPNDAKKFLKVIANNRPYEVLKYKDNSVGDDNFIKLWIITYEYEHKDVPLAIVWPDLVICPAADMQKIIPRGVSWWDRNGIKDPVSILQDDEKGLIFDWLKSINVPDDSPVVSCLRQFKDDVNVKTGGTYEAGHSLMMSGKFDYLGNAKKISGNRDGFLEKSNVLLKHREGKECPDLLILTNDYNWNISITKLYVAGSYTVDTIISSVAPHGYLLPQNRKKLITIDLNDYNAELRLATDLFTEKIAIVEGSGAFPNALGKDKLSLGNYTVIIPFKQEILNYFTPEELADAISIDRDSIPNKKIKIQLRLPLSGLEGDNWQPLYISKEYINDDMKKKNEILECACPLIDLWPNFILRDKDRWQGYYSFYDDVKEDNTFYAYPDWKNIKPREVAVSRGRAEIIQSTEFPEAYICQKEIQARGSKQTVDVGLILLAKPAVPAFDEAAGEVKIGIDFGTTNTVAYMLKNAEGEQTTPEPIKLNIDHIFKVTGRNEEEELRKHFIPDVEDHTSSSVRSIFNVNNKRTTLKEIKPLLYKGNIYYLNNLRISNDTSEEEFEDSIQTIKNIIGTLQTDSMKWDTDGSESRYGFLLQLCMQCLAEAVLKGAKTVNWEYSYPTSFSNTKKEHFKGDWHNLLKHLSFLSPSVMKNTSASGKTESETMVNYFCDHGGQPDGGMICFDIGGGTTDIGVWQKGKVCHQQSLLLAGKNLLNNYLFKKRKSVIMALKPQNDLYESVFTQLKNEDQEKEFSILLEALLKYNEEEIFEALNAKAQHPAVKIMLRDIIFILSGMLYYMGMVIGKLRLDGKYKTGSIPNCYFGGNASKLLLWAGRGHFDPNGSLVEIMFRRFFMLGIHEVDKSIEKDIANKKKFFEFNMSKQPKEEVAYGLVCNDSGITANSSVGGGSYFDDDEDSNSYDAAKDLAEVFAGEDYYLEDTSRFGSWNEYITRHDVVQNLKISEDCDIFKKFLANFNKYFKKYDEDSKSFNPSEEDISKIVSKANEKLATQCRNTDKNEELVVLEPLFIILLRETLEYLSDQEVTDVD